MKCASFKAILPIATLLLISSGVSKASVLFSDGFESGDRSHTESNIRWTSDNSTSVSSELPKNGAFSLRLNETYAGDGDSFAEQRGGLGGQYTEIWIKYDLYIPSNYYHYNDAPGNNKFFAIFSDPYTNPGFQVNFSTEPNGSGGSNLEIKQYYNGGEKPGIGPSSGKNFITTSDLGVWSEIVIHIKVPTGDGTGDGIMQLWKNGKNFIDLTNLNDWGGSKNYFDAFYLLGWANAGFRQDTVFYIDNVVISDSMIGLNPPSAPEAQ
jgi:hypothetical protein